MIMNTVISGGGTPAPGSDRQIAYNLSNGVLTTGNTTPANFFDGVTMLPAGFGYSRWTGNTPVGVNGVVDASSVRGFVGTTFAFGGDHHFECAYAENPNITEFIYGIVGGLKTSFFGAFYLCSGLTKCNFLFADTIGTSSSSSGLYHAFDGCSNTEIRFSAVNTITSYGAPYAFANTDGVSVYFPAFKTASSTSNALYNAANGATNITFHFPQNMQSVVETFRQYSTTAPFASQSGTVLFDLPSTYTLTGADGNTYERNPAYDTGTALAWYNTALDPDNISSAYGRTTPYYTSGTSDPATSDTIYSDSACTVAATTIDSIA